MIVKPFQAQHRIITENCKHGRLIHGFTFPIAQAKEMAVRWNLPTIPIWVMLLKLAPASR